MDREIIYMTVTAFPVAVERVIHPELRGRPVVVAPFGAARSVVTALSSEAWKAGIRKGMPLAKAMRYCRNAIVLPPNEPLYLRASRAIFKVLENFSPVLEPSGHGHAYLDITGTGRLFGPPRDTAWKAQKEIRRQLRLDASLGIASNKMVSRIASEVIRPAGLQDVPHGSESAFLSPLPVRLLPGVGLQTERQFDDLNIRIIHDIAAMRVDLLTLAFGRFGFVLHQRALGIDRTPVYPIRAVPALEQGSILSEDSNDYEILKGILFDLCENAGKQLREKTQCAGRVELRIRYADYREEGHRLQMKPPVRSSAVLYARTLPLLDLILKRRTRVRSMNLCLTELSHGSVQLELFADPKPDRHLKLEHALDTLRKRYGESVISRQSAVGSRQYSPICRTAG
ncbi:MAG: DNA polymerase IV [Acidobacteria bacterium]|nr:DNA polymerase IV [Acidobacteriota bacterium]